MKTSVRWSETADAVNGIQPPINAVTYSPSGDYIVASRGTRVLVYAALTGTLLHSLKGHHDTVYCVDYGFDGKSFASGGADRMVIVWSNKGEGIIKYQHKESIQAIAHNPAASQLASISSTDWGLWTPDQAKVSKYALPSKGLCGSWTEDGQHLAIGCLDGTIMVLARGLEERARIKRNAPVWSLGFSPLRDDGVDTLVVASWDQRISFYNTVGEPTGKERELDFDPCCVSFYNEGEYMMVSGGNHKVTLFTKDGNRLVDVADADDWIWSAKQRPHSKQICCGTNDGTISCIEISISTVHSIFKDQYVYRKGMTDVMVHQLTLDRQMKVPCNDYVRKLATYRDLLAVQLQERVIIFQLFYDDERAMRYQDIAQIRRKLDCSQLCVTSNAILTTKDRRITLYDFEGNKRREWLMESHVRYIKATGGMEAREVLLVGLQGGQVLKLFVDNPFPTLLHKAGSGVKSADLSSTRTRLAVIDDNNVMQVFKLGQKNELLFTETNVTAAAWNSEIDELIAYTTGHNMLSVKHGSLPAYQQSVRGVVVGFKANNIFNLHHSRIMTLTAPHSHALYKYIEQKEFDAAYAVACHGVADSDWKMLGLHAMTHFRLDVARRAFTRTQEVRFVELLKALELKRRQSVTVVNSEDGEEKARDNLLLGDILAFQGKYKEAARQFTKNGAEGRAIEMYSDMKMWDEAKKVCSDEKLLKDLIRQQARWAEDSHNYTEAATLYENCGDYAKAISMMGQSGQLDKLMTMCRSLPKSEVSLVTECANFFREQNAIDYAIEAYGKVGDNRSLIRLYVGVGEWRKAFTVLEKAPECARDVYVPWASWLAENDKFEEALEAFRAAKWPREATRLMETLASNSVTCRKFRDAAFYYTHLANEYGQFEDDEVLTDAQKAARMKKCGECIRRADIYYAFSTVYEHTTQPLPYHDRSLFFTAKYLLAMCSDGLPIPMNVGKAETLYTLARIANRLDMVRTARSIFEKLQSVILPIPLIEQVDVETLVVRSKPLLDRDELLDRCFRCNQVVPQLTGPGDCCPNCFHPCVRSFANFECLPLVEFVLSDELTDAEAEQVLISGIGAKKINENGEDNGEEAGKKNGKAKEWQSESGADVINFESDNIDYQIDEQLKAMGRSSAAANKGGDPFFTQLQYVLRPGRTSGVYQPFVANLGILKMLRRDEVFVVKPRYGSLPVPNRYYRVMRSDVYILLCDGCQHFFIAEDYETQCMKGSGCPLCRFRPGRQVARSMKRILLDMEAAAAAGGDGENKAL